MLMPAVCGLTFEFTRPAEVGGVSPVCDDATAGTHRACTACRSGSGVQRGVRRHRVGEVRAFEFDEIKVLRSEYGRHTLYEGLRWRPNSPP
jgi:hypothetical protein